MAHSSCSHPAPCTPQAESPRVGGEAPEPAMAAPPPVARSGGTDEAVAMHLTAPASALGVQDGLVHLAVQKGGEDPRRVAREPHREGVPHPLGDLAESVRVLAPRCEGDEAPTARFDGDGVALVLAVQKEELPALKVLAVVREVHEAGVVVVERVLFVDVRVPVLVVRFLGLPALLADDARHKSRRGEVERVEAVDLHDPRSDAVKHAAVDVVLVLRERDAVGALVDVDEAVAVLAKAGVDVQNCGPAVLAPPSRASAHHGEQRVGLLLGEEAVLHVALGRGHVAAADNGLALENAPEARCLLPWLLQR
eukprot:CAMPEP_0202085498 /NCGR_PEP_ID=MMETSP0964-20121228/30941_1 /ASSEMBLY_ACC=CAM_ASM_000500 /TAXON_ID=4773 /ORGANISM="Schizochytrium aggregatum, Strain ATCC28209" /LENGTH=308 /DNA_ID=CAMNT_0048653331 /DNA_START=89 /DNA_END=1012 /DNA_ORIENTATION=-